MISMIVYAHLVRSAVLDTHAVIHHVLNIAPVLRQNQFLFLCIVSHIVIIACYHYLSFSTSPSSGMYS